MSVWSPPPRGGVTEYWRTSGPCQGSRGSSLEHQGSVLLGLRRRVPSSMRDHVRDTVHLHFGPSPREGDDFRGTRNNTPNHHKKKEKKGMKRDGCPSRMSQTETALWPGHRSHGANGADAAWK